MDEGGRIQPHFRLSLCLVRTMAFKAIVGQNGAYITVEIDALEIDALVRLRYRLGLNGRVSSEQNNASPPPPHGTTLQNCVKLTGFPPKRPNFY